MSGEVGAHSRRSRTRRALIEAFNRLVLIHRRRRIRVPDIVAEAGVGRSTFYDHFKGADHIRREALATPFAALADAALGRGDDQSLERLLMHFWDNRQHARAHFSGRAGEDSLRLLGEMVEQRLEGERLLIPKRLAAQQLAAAALAPIRGWLLGVAPSNPADLSSTCRSVGNSMLAALRKA